ncbi:hypothetical protein N665_1411s0021 [Sinapis alba]|nr:hypothetical protein N665_1411s0021 [Sinapis alba]
MEQCRQGKSAKWIQNFGKRIGSEGWARGSQFRTRRLLADCSSCLRGENGPSRCSECQSEEIQPSADSLRRVDPGGGHCQVGSLAGAAHLLKDNAGVLR